MLRHRRPATDQPDSLSSTASDRSARLEKVMDDSEQRPLLDEELQSAPEETPKPQSWAQRNQWIVLALASGACAAFNGVFAKLYVPKMAFPFPMASATLARVCPAH